MTEKYILKSKRFEGSVVFAYKEGKLCLYSNDSSMSEVQVKWLLPNLPLERDHLEDFQRQIKGTITIAPIDLTFGHFWEIYKRKINRKRVEPLWKKMTDSMRTACLLNIPIYDAFLKRSGGRGKLDPENYLRQESYNTNWNEV